MTVLLYKGCSAWTASNKNAQATWRSRLVGRGRATGNRVTRNRVREFESLLLRQKENRASAVFLFAKRTGSFEVSSVAQATDKGIAQQCLESLESLLLRQKKMPRIAWRFSFAKRTGSFKKPRTVVRGFCYQNACLPSMARLSVTSSAYSISPPTGMP